jgi:hypothetical protein
MDPDKFFPADNLWHRTRAAGFALQDTHTLNCHEVEGFQLQLYCQRSNQALSRHSGRRELKRLVGSSIG